MGAGVWEAAAFFFFFMEASTVVFGLGTGWGTGTDGTGGGGGGVVVAVRAEEGGGREAGVREAAGRGDFDADGDWRVADFFGFTACFTVFLAAFFGTLGARGMDGAGFAANPRETAVFSGGVGLGGGGLPRAFGVFELLGAGFGGVARTGAGRAGALREAGWIAPASRWLAGPVLERRRGADGFSGFIRTEEANRGHLEGLGGARSSPNTAR